MSRKQKWVWEIYFAIVLFFAVEKIILFFNPGSSAHLYYSILKSFGPVFFNAHTTHTVHVFLNLIHCVPLFLYIYRINFLHTTFWKYLFVLRCIFEIIGSSYEINTLTAFYHSSPKIFLLILVSMVGPLIPSYFACYQYAFQSQDKWK